MYKPFGVKLIDLNIIFLFKSYHDTKKVSKLLEIRHAYWKIMFAKLVH